LDIPILASYFKAKTLKQRSKSFFSETGMTQERLSVSSAPRVRRKVLEIKTKNVSFKILEVNCFSTNYSEIA
jgi:hypothetical protein